MMALIDAEELEEEEFKINFDDEPGLDNGGLTKEWLSLVTSELFSPAFGLFAVTSEGLLELSATVFHHPDTALINKHLDFVGKILGLCLQQNVPANVTFAAPFYRSLMQLEPLHYPDPETPWLDKLLLRDAAGAPTEEALVYRENVDPQKMAYFETVPLSQPVLVQLSQGGADALVSEEDWTEYVRLRRVHRLKFMTAPPAMLASFADETIRLENEAELEQALRGVSIDMADWQNVTRTYGDQKDWPIYTWFWDILRSRSPADQSFILTYWTGLKAMPFGGFTNVDGGMAIRFMDDIGNLLKARTCFNWLDIPNARTKEELLAIFEESLRIPLGYEDV
jgi:E3 ubiquitin ligase SMURF1/2